MGLNMKSLCFTTKATESEHFLVEDEIKRQCDRCGAKITYYGQLKSGHVPMMREVIIDGNDEQLNFVEAYLNLHDYLNKKARNN